MFSKKVNIRLILAISLFMGSLIFINIKLTEHMLERSMKYTFMSETKEEIKILENKIELLKYITEKIAENDEIISILNDNRTFEKLNENEKDTMAKQINNFEGVLETVTFVDTINITSIQGEYLFSNGNIYEDFHIESRPWFNESDFIAENKVVLTELHKDFITGKYVIALASMIYSKSNEVIGVVIFDVYIDNLIENIEESYYLGDLDVYIEVEGGDYYRKGITVTEDYLKNNKGIVRFSEKLTESLKIEFVFNKNSMQYINSIKSGNNYINMTLLLAGIVFIFILMRSIKLIFKPVANSLDKLKDLVDTLENNNESINDDDEFKQLEIISNSLGESLNRKIESLIYYDDLTKLPNRKMLLTICNKLIDSKEKFALIFIDLNGFKGINDVFGHVSGDEILFKFSNTMKKSIGNKGILTRYSGDEFIIIYDSYIDNKELELFYKTKILKNFEKPIEFNGNKTRIQFSAGASVYPRDGESFDELVKKSDFMMYSSKKSLDKNGLIFFNNSIYNKILRNEIIKDELKEALKNDELILYYQPIVDKNNNIKKVEALIRWRNSKLGFVSPVDFITQAEESSEIINIGYWIIEEVCKNFKNIFEEEAIEQVSINVSPIQLMEFEFTSKVKKVIEKYNVNSKNLCFEITESVVLDGNIIIYDNLYSLNKLGINIALDDFGTGYASFSYLKKFKMDILKIDKIFIDNGSVIDFEIVRNIKNIAKLLNMKIVIEGVETEKQFYNLKKIGCDYFQGYHFSKPISLGELKDMMQIHNKNNQ